MPFLAGGLPPSLSPPPRLHHILRWRETIETFLTELGGLGASGSARRRCKVNGFSSPIGYLSFIVYGQFLHNTVEVMTSENAVTKLFGIWTRNKHFVKVTGELTAPSN